MDRTMNVAVVGAGGQGGYAFRRAASEENLASIKVLKISSGDSIWHPAMAPADLFIRHNLTNAGSRAIPTVNHLL